MTPVTFDNLAIAIISFTLGNITGYMLRVVVNKSKFNFLKTEDARISFILTVVTTIWVLSMLYDILSPIYETSPLLHGIMGAIVGYFFYKPNKNE